MSCPTCHQEFTNVDEFDSHLDSAHQSLEELELGAIAEVIEEVIEFDDVDADADADGDADADATNNTDANDTDDTEADDADDDNVDDDDDDTPAMDDSNSTETETEQKRSEPVRYLIFFCSTSFPLTSTLRWFDQHIQAFHTLRSAVD